MSSRSSRSSRSSQSARRPWLVAVGGAILVTAAVVTAVALVSNDSTSPAPQPSPATQDTSTAGSPSTPSESTSAPVPDAGTPIYYLGDTPAGLRLYREFNKLPEDNPLQAALDLVTTTPKDPDYTTMWPQGSFADVTFDGKGNDGLYTVTLAYADLHDRPDGMSEAQARLAIQAVIYTLHAVGGNEAPVQFAMDGNPIDQVLSVPTSEPLAADPVLKTLSHVSLTVPDEGDAISGDTLTVAGEANSFEANVLVRLQRYEGTEVVAQVAFTADGWMEDRLFPFSGELDIAGVQPGRYILMAMTDDPSGGEEGPGAFTDTRVIEIQ